MNTLNTLGKSLGLVALAPLAIGVLGASSPPEPTNDSIEDYLDSHPNISVSDEAVHSARTARVEDEEARVVESLSRSGGSGSVPFATESSETESTSLDDASPTEVCGVQKAVFVNVTGWEESIDGCGIIGANDQATHIYSWNTDSLLWNAGPSCVEGRGYSTDPAIQTPEWFGAGCGTSGSVEAHLGERASVAKIRGRSNAPATVGYVLWQ